MKSSLHIIESNSLYGLSDSYEHEIVECVYDRIKSLKNGKYIVVKDKKAGILDSNGKILLYPQPNRLHTIEQIDIFFYKVDGEKVYFTFINNQIYYLSADKLKYDEKCQILNVWKDGTLNIYNKDFIKIQTSYEQIEQTELRQGNSRFYLGMRNGKWGVFRIKRPQKHEPEIITTIEPVFCISEDALFALKDSRHNTVRINERTKSIAVLENEENNNRSEQI